MFGPKDWQATDFTAVATKDLRLLSVMTENLYFGIGDNIFIPEEFSYCKIDPLFYGPRNFLSIKKKNTLEKNRSEK
jgi:hypothetical protein